MSIAGDENEVFRKMSVIFPGDAAPVFRAAVATGLPNVCPTFQKIGKTGIKFEPAWLLGKTGKDL